MYIKVDAYLNFAHGTNHHLKANDLINPALPPKLHKSLTNLKTTATTITATPSSSAVATSSSGLNTNSNNHRKNHNNNNNNVDNSNTTASNSNTTSTNCNNFSSSSSSSGNNAPTANTTSVQTIYTLSKPHHSSLTTALTPNNTNLIGLTTSSSNNSSSPSSHTNSSVTVAAVSNLLQTRKSEHDHIMKITQQQPPSLTLPLSTTSTISSFTSSTSKINSSTFYPLQNNVTYTLPKNIGGKMSLNSTINSVVSKVPSVISLPSTSAGHNEHLNVNYNGGQGHAGSGDHHSYHASLHNNHDIAANVALSKSTTLPKILRTKRDTSSSSSSHYNSSNNGGHNATSTNNSSSQATSSTNTSNNYAVSQCSMPAYPKQYTSMSSANNATNTTNSSSSQHQQQSTHSHNSQSQQQQQHQQPPTNINMQTQTITSTLAANYCPEDSHLNIHNSTNSNQSNTNNTTNPSSHSSSSSKQLPVCTTSKNCLNPKEHFLPNDTSLDDDYLSECENCKIAQSSKYYLDAEALASGPQETMTLQRKSMEECKEEPETGYYRISHTLPTNSKKNK